jgi:hypothetical protein
VMVGPVIFQCLVPAKVTGRSSARYKFEVTYEGASPPLMAAAQGRLAQARAGIRVLGTTFRRLLVLLGAAALALVVLPLTAANAAPRATGGVTITGPQDPTGCGGVLTNNGSGNTTKTLVGGTLVPGGTAIFEISFPFDPTKLSGQDTFNMTDCVFVGDQPDDLKAKDALQLYDISGVPNGTSPFTFSITLDIPNDAALLGQQYCNFLKTTANPTAPQESNRKAGPACFRIGGDIQVTKVAGDTGDTLAGASFDVSCDPPGTAPTTPPVVISGIADGTSIDGGNYVASGVSSTGVITIVGPIATVCTVTETAAPTGYGLADPVTQTLTIGADRVTTTFVDPRIKNTTAISTVAKSVTLGAAISDTATLVGATEDASGTITFSAYDTADCSNDPVFTDSADVSGNGDYTSGPFTPTAAGSYFWVAAYSGDDANKASTGTCGDEGETSVVTAPTTSSTPPSTPPGSTGVAPQGASSAPLAATGASHVSNEMAWALALLILGAALTTTGIRRYQRRH